jgi:hypothetical protein
MYSCIFTMGWGQSVAGILLQRPGFSLRLVHVEFVTYELAQGQFVFLVLLLFSVPITPLVFHTY